MAAALGSIASLSLDGGCHAWACDDCLVFVGAHCGRLAGIELRSCAGIGARGIEALAAGCAAKSLVSLGMHSCGDIGSGACLSGLTRLSSLRLSWATQVTSAGLAPLAPCLRVLQLHGCEAIDDGICTRLQQVEELSLAYTAVKDAGLALLASRSLRLRALTLACQQYNNFSCAWTTDAGEAAFCAARPDVALARVT
ncbi:hypothetical protein FOA52_002433 [Chlamydomonas sp. UWO 241]|nr:hypothetical protein FOA52_002433 [Chlamydomonas sp. UWO 241]